MMQQGMDIPHLSKTEILKPLMATPSLLEQKAIGLKLESIIRLINSEEKALCKFAKVKNSLMQDLLTGEVQITPDEIDKELAHA